jgi:hypothetical protein
LLGGANEPANQRLISGSEFKTTATRMRFQCNIAGATDTVRIFLAEIRALTLQFSIGDIEAACGEGNDRTAMAASSRLKVRLLCYRSAQYLSEMNWTSNGLTCAWKT